MGFCLAFNPGIYTTVVIGPTAPFFAQWNFIVLTPKRVVCNLSKLCVLFSWLFAFLPRIVFCPYWLRRTSLYIHWFFCCYCVSLIDWLFDSFTHLLTHSLTHSLINSFVDHLVRRKKLRCTEFYCETSVRGKTALIILNKSFHCCFLYCLHVTRQRVLL